MAEYANIKRKIIIRLLNWLATKKSIYIKKGGKHQYLIECVSWERPFPIPFKHKEINRFIVKELIEKLAKSGICTREEFDEKIK